MNLAYVAGLFDGEGCARFARCRTSVFPAVHIVNTDRAIIEDLRDYFGGTISTIAHRRANWKPSWSWRLTWSPAVDFLDAISPWLRIKCAQAATVFAWDAIRLGSGSHLGSERQREYRDALTLLVSRMTWLNTRGPRRGDDPIEAYCQ